MAHFLRDVRNGRDTPKDTPAPPTALSPAHPPPVSLVLLVQVTHGLPHRLDDGVVLLDRELATPDQVEVGVAERRVAELGHRVPVGNLGGLLRQSNIPTVRTLRDDAVRVVFGRLAL